MKRTFISLAILLAMACAMQAKPRTKAQLRSEAAKALNARAAANGKKARANATGMEVLGQSSQLTILGHKDGGYAVIANDDTFDPVLGYSDGTLTDDAPPAFTWWLNTINRNLEDMLAKGEKPGQVERAAGYKTAVDELLTTQWSQEDPYNRLCPTYLSNNVETPYVTGCVATAMAQILYYHKYPTKGYGSKSYFFYPEEGGSRQRAFANFGNTTYDYANMISTYANNNFTTEQATAVATIMYHCGVSVEMGYSKSGSGAFSNDACLALRKHFLYDENIKMYRRDFYNKKEWMDMVYRELNDACPILYGGATTSNAGHSFVLDGYDANGLVHVNWGWNGKSNGYYDIASLLGYSEGQDMVVVRLPDDTRFDSRYHSLWGLGYPLNMTKSGTNLVASCQALYNLDVESFTGDIDILAANLATGETTQMANANSVSMLESGYGFQFSNLRFSVSALADGKYRLYLASKDSRDTDWQPVRSNESVRNSYILEKNGAAMTLTPESDSGWTGETTGIDQAMDDGDSQSGGKKAFTGKIYSIDGRYMGTDKSALKSGIYIMDGKKFVK